MWFKKKERKDENFDIKINTPVKEAASILGFDLLKECKAYITEYGPIFIDGREYCTYDINGNKIIDKGMIKHYNLAQFKKGTSSVDIVVNAIKNNTSDINGAINNTISRRGNEPEKS